MTDERVRVSDITGPQAAELRARDGLVDWQRERVARLEADLVRERQLLAVAENERLTFAREITRTLGLPDGPEYRVSAESGSVTAPADQVQRAIRASQAAQGRAEPIEGIRTAAEPEPAASGSEGAP